MYFTFEQFSGGTFGAFQLCTIIYVGRKIMSMLFWKARLDCALDIETGLLSHRDEVVYRACQRGSAGAMFGGGEGSQLENVAQDCPAFSCWSQGAIAHGLCDGDDRLAIGIIGIVDQRAAIGTGLNFAATSGRGKRL